MQVKWAEYITMLIFYYKVQLWHVDCHPFWKEYKVYCNNNCQCFTFIKERNQSSKFTLIVGRNLYFGIWLLLFIEVDNFVNVMLWNVSALKLNWMKLQNKHNLHY